MNEFDESEVAEHYANEARRDHEMHDEEAMSMKVEPIEAWAAYNNDGSPVLTELDGTDGKLLELKPKDDPEAWAMHEFFTSTDRRVERVVIVPLAEWERVNRYDARTMPLGDLYDVYDERMQDSISEDE